MVEFEPPGLKLRRRGKSAVERDRRHTPPPVTRDGIPTGAYPARFATTRFRAWLRTAAGAGRAPAAIEVRCGAPFGRRRGPSTRCPRVPFGCRATFGADDGQHLAGSFAGASCTRPAVESASIDALEPATAQLIPIDRLVR